MLPDPPGPAPRWLLDFASALHSRPCPCPTQTLPWLPVLIRAPGPQKATPFGNRVFAGVTKVGPEPTRSRAGPARREEVTQAGRRQEGADAATSQRTKEGPPRAPRLDTSGLQGVNLSCSKARPAPPGLRSLPHLRVLQSASHRPAQHCLQAFPRVHLPQDSSPRSLCLRAAPGTASAPHRRLSSGSAASVFPRACFKDPAYCFDFVVSSSFLFKERIGWERYGLSQESSGHISMLNALRSRATKEPELRGPQNPFWCGSQHLLGPVASSDGRSPALYGQRSGSHRTYSRHRIPRQSALGPREGAGSHQRNGTRLEDPDPQGSGHPSQVGPGTPSALALGSPETLPQPCHHRQAHGEAKGSPADTHLTPQGRASRALGALGTCSARERSQQEAHSLC
ncbi:uncharacterized protein LOC128312381 [Acinonyx jubatus]|uniref:Uncharacterized protein LOC128312381 n=1 Tax=Acinonyx jubatus TaxID=32536 RepID=A0ABM3NR63_ACIJB|nr:uncharacterized protein LOC128312381 [Acinonyx jubatus]